MSSNSKIEWTTKTWNPITGCTKVSQGCANCYAEREWPRLQHSPLYAGRKFTDVAFHDGRLEDPFKWKKPCMIFVNSLSDLFHPAVTDGQLFKIFNTIAGCQQHIFQVLTKRPERMREFLHVVSPAQFTNLWLGVSVEDQATADERIPILIDTPASVRWVSAEPLLGHVDIDGLGWRNTYPNDPRIDWVVAGGESGPRAPDVS